MKTFGEFVKDRIRRVGRNQKELAAKLGVSPAYISQIFTGKKNPPDLGKSRNKAQLKVWAEFLDVEEDDVLEIVRSQLHGVSLRATPRYRAMRTFLLSRLGDSERELIDEIQRMEFHPAENQAIAALARIYLAIQEDDGEDHAYGATRLRELCERIRANREFVENGLVRFFDERPFAWAWDREANEVRLFSESPEIRRAADRLDAILGQPGAVNLRKTVPVVGHVSAGEGFAFTDGGYPVGEGFERVELPPGISPNLSHRLYCVRIRGNSLKEFINEGTLLFIKPESWEEIRDGDLVIFKDCRDNRAFVKKVEFSGENLILKSMNPLFGNIVLRKSELILLERVMSLVL